MKLTRRLVFAPSLLVCTVAACSSSNNGPTLPPPDSCSNVPAASLSPWPTWFADPHYCLFVYADTLPGARGLAVAPNGDVFVVSNSQVWVLPDDNGDGISDADERQVFATGTELNHGLAITPTHVYASSKTTVYRWRYASGDRVATGPPETVIFEMPTGGHGTRTLVIDAQNRLYVSAGSGSNVDLPPGPTMFPLYQAVIRRFDLDTLPAGGYEFFYDGELFATGLRNEVGVSIDSKGRMWGVENGRDNLIVGGEDIHFDNPAEEVNLFDTNRPGRAYGYPFCWSEGIWMDPTRAKGPGTQHLDPDVPGGFSEAACQDTSVVVPPVLTLGAHLAPLDIIEYRGSAYPPDLTGDLFVTSHGSWNRENQQVGRLIIRLRMGANGPTEAQNFFGQGDGMGNLVQAGWGHLPVSIRVDKNGLLTFSSDASGMVFKIGYKP
jgi:glucose/arabinose dehydrogenase